MLILIVVVVVIASFWLSKANETSSKITDIQTSEDKCNTSMENYTMNHTTNNTATIKVCQIKLAVTEN